MSDQEKSVHWLKWLSVVVLLIAGVVGLGLSLCGGVFLLGSLTSGSGGVLQGVAPIAAVALAVGLVVLVVSMRQLVSVWREPGDAGQARLPAAVKRAAVLTTIDFLLSGMWFFLPLIVSLLRRRRWSRQLILAVLAIKWLTAPVFFLRSGGAVAYIGYGAIYVALDAAVLVTLFSRSVSEWFAEEARER
jgi:hypothetical protein